MPMTSQERVSAALRLAEPDRVPWVELHIDPRLAELLLHWGGPEGQTFSLEENQYTWQQALQVASYLHLDNISKARTQLVVGEGFFIQPNEKLICDIENLLGEEKLSLII